MMNWKLRILALTGMAIICTFTTHLYRAPAFTGLNQAQQTLKGAGYHCVSDCADGTTVNSFVISRRPIDWQEANALRKTGPLGPEWNGRAWATVKSSKITLATGPGEVPPRAWGEIIVFGDQKLLDEIEQGVRM